MPYLDWNATTPPLDAVLDAMRDAAARAWGNPASVHSAGRAARARVEDARGAIAALASADPRDVILTGGGTEANNVAIRSAFSEPPAAGTAPPLLVTSRIEHPSVTRVAEALEREGRARLRWLRVLADGQIDVDDLVDALRAGDARVVTLQTVNHETGVLQPVARALDAVRAARGREGAIRARLRVHVDAVQAFGKIGPELLAPTLDADTISVGGHKIRGPKGIGALITRPGTRISPVLLGGAQERGLRPGTVDPIACAGLAVAAQHALASPERYAATVAPLRDALEAGLLARGATLTAVGPPRARAPHVASCAFPGWQGAELVAAFDLEGLCVSSGSACSAGTMEISPVITAMRGAEVAATVVRFSLGESTTRADVDDALTIVSRVLSRAP
jgi:cysteine desulfurase